MPPDLSPADAVQELTYREVSDLQRRAKRDGIDSLNAVERQLVVRAQEQAKKFLAPFLPHVHKMAAEVREAEELTGLAYDEIVDCIPDLPAEYGKTRPGDIVAAARMGHQGWDAVHVAASWHRLPPVPRCAAPRRVSDRSRRPRRDRRSTARAPDRPRPQPDLADQRGGLR